MIAVIVKFYLAVCLTLIVHEAGHYCCAKLLGIEVTAILLGSELLSVTVGKVRISPLMIGGGVEVTEESLEKCGRLRTCLFFLGGIAFNSVLLIAVLQRSSFNAFLIRSIDELSLLFNVCGFWIKGSDTNMLLHYLKSV